MTTLIIIAIVVVVLIFLFAGSGNSNTSQLTAGFVHLKDYRIKSTNVNQDEVNGFVQKFYGMQKLTDDERTRLIELQNSATEETDKDFLSSLSMEFIMRECGARERSSQIVDIQLKPNEKLYFKSREVSLSKLSVISYNISSISYRAGQNGFRMYNGSIYPQKHEGMKVQSHAGVLYITTERIIYIASNGKSSTIKLGNIIDFAVSDENMLTVTVQNGSPYVFAFNRNGVYSTENSNIWDDAFESATALSFVLNANNA